MVHCMMFRAIERHFPWATTATKRELFFHLDWVSHLFDDDTKRVTKDRKLYHGLQTGFFSQI